jgi:hypothetical protein
MNILLALRNVAYRPWRSLLLLVGYGIGVAVMIVLLAIGEALLIQARDEKLVGGGDITVLPEGIDIEVMKTGGLGGMFFSIDNARFIQLQLLASPRLSGVVRTVAPQIEDKLIYLRKGDMEIPVRATGEIPSASNAVGGGAEFAAGAWADDDADRVWLAPGAAELRHGIDHFHTPPDSIENRDSWGEWHYFNIVSADGKRWAFISLRVGGDIPDGEWGGQVLVTTHEQGSAPGSGRVRRFVSSYASAVVHFRTDSANITIGNSSVRVLANGDYHVRANASAVDGGGNVAVDLVVSPSPGAYFPGASIGGTDFTSGYAVAALRADASGEICEGTRCERFDAAQSYHDHNWGVWRGVTWEWGAARAGSFSLLYGRVEPPDADREGRPLFLYLVDSLGYRALFRPSRIEYTDGATVQLGNDSVNIPVRGVMIDIRGRDTLRVELEIEDATVTDMRKSLVERGEVLTARSLERPFFLQMKGRARISGRVGGAVVEGEGIGFFETYR